MTTLPYLGIATGEKTYSAAGSARSDGSREDVSRADGSWEGGARSDGSREDDTREDVSRADSADLTGSPFPAAERTDPSGAVPRPYDVRTLRILALLEERTDETRALTSTDIKNLLAHPDDPDVPPIQTTNSSIRHSIGALRAVGLAIRASNHTGFALVERALPASDMELVLHTVWTSAGLGAAQRTRLMGELLPLAPPALRERFESLVAGEEVADPEPAEERVVVEKAEHLVRRAIERELPLAFELARTAPALAARALAVRALAAPGPVANTSAATALAAPGPASPDPAATTLATHGTAPMAPTATPPGTAATHRYRLLPQELFVAHGTAFVRGRAEPEDAPAHERAPLPSGLDTHRTFRLDRMVNIALRDEDGTLHVANTDGGPALATSGSSVGRPHTDTGAHPSPAADAANPGPTPAPVNR